MKDITLKVFFLVLLVLGVIHMSLAGKPAGTKNESSLKKTAAHGVYSAMDINNVFNYYSNNGDGSFQPVFSR